MDISGMRRIGAALIEEVRRFMPRPGQATALGTGAAGDKTFPVDKRAEDLIISMLNASGEPLTVISEEAGILDIHGGGARVVIDPIDGSKNAISGLPFFCTSIAVASGDRISDVTLSYVVSLVSGDEFWAEKGRGAFLNGSPIGTQGDDVFALVAYEAQSPGKDIPRIGPLLGAARKTRCFGATALDLSYLAMGAISVFICPSPSRSFDFAGGLLIVREAGGVVTDTEGNDIGGVALGLERSTPLLASGNSRLHERAIGLLSRGVRDV
jgi:myo-inositol-1(or 4)-monophosphatase